MSDNIETKQETKLNIYQKLVKVREQVLYIQKTAKGQFSYAPGSAIIAALRNEMDDQNLLLVTNMESFQIIEIPGAKNSCAKIELSYTWIDADSPSDRLTTNYTYIDQKAGVCQGIGSVLTYAERYFLCKFFQIATDEQDPDAFMKLHDFLGNDDEVVADEAKDAKESRAPIVRMSYEEAARIINSKVRVENPKRLEEYLEFCISKIDIPLSKFVDRLLSQPDKFLDKYNQWLAKNPVVAA